MSIKSLMKKQGFTHKPGFPDICQGCGKEFPLELDIARKHEFPELDWTSVLTMKIDKIRKIFPTKPHFQGSDIYMCSCGTLTVSISQDHYLSFYKKVK